jgi:putative redox protein
MQCKIEWVGNETMSFVAETGSGHTLKLDTAPDSGGKNLGPRPMELVLVGATTCSTYDIVRLIKEKAEVLSYCSATAIASRVEKNPKVFNLIKVHFIIKGSGISEKDIDAAIELTKNVYGSANKMLSSVASINYSYELEKI